MRGSSSGRGLASLSACLLVATLVSAPQRAGAGAVENARAYLAISQLPSGLFRQASLADTAEALAALEDPGVKQSAQIAALISVPGNNEDGLARLAILSLARSGDPVAAAAFRSSLESGELGLAPGSAAWDPMVLAWALRFAAADASSAGLVPLLAVQLQALARPEGGYGFADNASDLALTSEMVRALRAAGPFYEVYAAPSAQWVAAQVSSASLASLSAADLALAILAAGGALPAERLSAAAAALALRQGADGSFDGDVRATALAIQAQRIVAPDLAVAFSATQDLSPVSGAPYGVVVRVTNGGASASPATAVGYTVADGSGAQVGSGQVQVGALAPGQTSSVNLDLGPQGAPGARVLTAVVNPDATFFERDLANNVGTLRFQVMGRPDLVIDATDLSITPSPAPLHQAAKVSMRVRNVGSAIARNVHAQLFAGLPGAGGTLIAEQFFNAVAPGTPRLIVAEFTPTTMLATTLVARVDPEDAIAEVDEGNNQTTLVVQPVEPAAILVDVTPVLSTGATIAQGNTLGLYYGATVTVSRYGQSYPVPELWPFDQVTTSLLVGPPGAETEVARQELPKASINLGSGQSKYFSMSTNGLDGPITFTVRADVDNRVAEVNEANNVATATFTITTADLPELPRPMPAGTGRR